MSHCYEKGKPFVTFCCDCGHPMAIPEVYAPLGPNQIPYWHCGVCTKSGGDAI